MSTDTLSLVARVNGQALHAPGESLPEEALRQRACTELLRQAAQAAGLLQATDVPGTDGVISEAASAAIEALLERELDLPEPSEEALRRHHAAHAAQYSEGERVRARHILFAVTPGVDVKALRLKAESVLLELRCHDEGQTEADQDQRFAQAAQAWSNCPSSAHGGAIGDDEGWLRASDCAPEFAREIFGHPEVGVLPRLVHSRFGLHVVEVLERQAGQAQPFEAVRGAVRLALQQQAYVTALRQYLRVLAGQATLEGVGLDGTDSSLVQ
jgi:peptidyl-prolyl cis-trans isomerase C